MIYFLADAHLGSLAIDRGWAHQKKLIRMLEMMSEDAVSIYMLGDMFDFWMEYFIHDKAKRQYHPFCKELRKLHKKGIHVHFFTGNHDLWTFGGLNKLTRVEVHYEPETIIRYGKTLYLAHGDGIIPSKWENLLSLAARRQVRKYQLLNRIFNNGFLQFLFRCLPPRIGNKIGYGWAKKSRIKEYENPCPFKGENKEELILFAKEQEKQGNHRDYYIFGHRHIELDQELSNGSRVVMLGDCFERYTYAKLDKHGNLTLHNFEEDLEDEQLQQPAENNAQ